jgi:GT2 family glycosyltransferase
MTESSSLPTEGVTVVVATLNRGGFLLQTIRDLLLQTHRPLEVLIVDQSDAPEAALSLLIAGAPEVVTYCSVQFRGLPQARNYGWLRARFERIVFVDDDVRIGPEFVAEHAKALTEPGVGVVAGGVDELSNDRSGRIGDFSFWLGAPRGAFAGVGEFDVVSAKGCNFSTTRSLLRQLGGIDELLGVGAALHEETEFCLRVRGAGLRVRFNGRARLIHLAAPSGGCRVREPRQYVRALSHNRALVLRRHLKPYHYPSALVRLLMLGAAYARVNRDPLVLGELVRGCVDGLRDGTRAPQCQGGCSG